MVASRTTDFRFSGTVLTIMTCLAIHPGSASTSPANDWEPAIAADSAAARPRRDQVDGQ